MDPLFKLNFKSDTTITLLQEALSLGIETWVTEPSNLTLSKTKTYAVARKIKDKSMKTNEEKELPIDYFDIFFIRQDPPFDMDYLSNCYMLEIHKNFNKRPFFVNDPSGIKNFTEKLFPLYYYNFMPETIVTSRYDRVLGMFDKFNALVLKPLYYKGGEGIERITKESNNKKALFEKIYKKYKSPVVVQEFIDKVKLGDKRVIIVDGDPLGVVNRIPKTKEFKANLHLGGEAKKTSLTKKEKEICKKLKNVFKKNRLFLVGIDLIDEKLTEINVTSPTGITQINDLYGRNLSREIWNVLTKYI